jgi:hypothetical protein
VHNARDHRPSGASHAAPSEQPTAKPMIAREVRLARPRALAALSISLPSSTSPMSIVKRVTLVVITAVDGAPLSEIWTSMFGTAIAKTRGREGRPAVCFRNVLSRTFCPYPILASRRGPVLLAVASRARSTCAVVQKVGLRQFSRRESSLRRKGRGRINLAPPMP